MSDFDRYEMVVTMDDGKTIQWGVSLLRGKDDYMVDVMRAMAAGAETVERVDRVSLVRVDKSDVSMYPPTPRPAPMRKSIQDQLREAGDELRRVIDKRKP